MARPLRLAAIFVLLSVPASFLAIVLTLLLLPATESAAVEPPLDPGVAWVLGADSPVTTEPHYQNQPAISGDMAAWEDCRPSGTSCGIYYKDLSNEDPEAALTPGVAHQSQAAVDGELIVYRQKITPPSGGVGYQIYYKYLGGAGLLPLSENSYQQFDPAVSGNRVVWTDERNGTWESDIYLYDLSSGTETPLCTESSRQEQPDIEGDWAIWVDNRGGSYSYGTPTKNDIYAKNIQTGEEQRLTFDEDDVIQSGPRISRDPDSGDMYAVWSGGGVWLYDFQQGTTTQLSAQGSYPDIDGDIVVWKGGASQINMYDATTGETKAVSGGGAQVFYPAVSASRIVWGDDRNGNRDIYQNLGERAKALADKYAPELHFPHDIYRDDRNDFEPRIVDLMVDGAEKLVIAGGEINDPVIQDLIENPGEDCYLDLPGSPANPFHSYEDDYKKQLGSGDYPLTTYAQVLQRPENTDKTVIQYWFNYYYDNWYNNHEGDWEMVEVILNNSLEPETAVYAQHGSSWKKDWNEWGLKKTGTHPQVFVAEGSHASYFFKSNALHFLEPGTPNDFFDTTGSVSWFIPAVDMNGLNGGWAGFMGLWGETKKWWWPPFITESGPKGPAFQEGDPFHQPITWADSSLWKGLANDLVASIFSPAEINLYDPQGRHVGKNAQGGIDLEIPGSEYFERDDDHSKNIVIHNADILSNFAVKIKGTGTGNMELKVQVPDFGGNIIDNPQYLAVGVSLAMQAELDLTQAKDFDLKVDGDGDGVVDAVLPPDINDQVTVDFSPPATVSDLTVGDITSGSATLDWSAPGDDDNQGTAFRYDLRYSKEQITEDDWQYATSADSLPDPQPAGSSETATITGLDAGTTYYFAIKARDNTWQESALSNVVSSITEIPNLTWGIKRIYWASWDDYYNRLLSIDYNLKNTGTGIAISPTIVASICDPTSVYVTTPLPLLVSDLDLSSTSTVTLKYYVPTSVGSFTTTTYVNCRDDAGRIYWFPGPL